MVHTIARTTIAPACAGRDNLEESTGSVAGVRAAQVVEVLKGRPGGLTVALSRYDPAARGTDGGIV